MSVHKDIPPFLTYVRSEYLYSLKEGFGYFSSATVFSISSYPGEFLSFHIVVDDTTMFSNIPICAITNSKTAPKIELEDACYEKCIDNEIIVSQYDYLASANMCYIWKKDKTLWQKGSYILSVEWPKNKSILHLIELDDGNYIAWPNHLITWGNDCPDKLPEYN